MAENYVVNYDINVVDNGSRALSSFITATQNLSQAATNIEKINNKLNSLRQKLQNFSTQKAYKININTKQAIKNVDDLYRKLVMVEQKAKSMGVSAGALIAAPSRGSTPKTSKTASIRQKNTPRIDEGIRYRALGQTLVDTGGVGALDFAKGMGLAYGMAGLGTMVSNVVKDAMEYDNIMQTTKNILKSHDNRGGFSERFGQMEDIVRNVGIQTKFTAPQVADASKFLAMAGFNIGAINNAIRPIADIALIGDNDLGQTADVVTNIMTGFGIAPHMVRRAADIMTQTFTMSNTTLMEMAEAYKYAGSLLARNGTSFEEATAAIGILGDAGIKGSQAGTTLRTLAINIAKPTAKQEEMWDSLRQKYGISRYNSDGSLKSMVDIFGQLSTADLQLADFSQLFHKTAASGASALTANVDKWNEIIQENFLSEGMSKKLADAKKETLQGLWAQLTSSFTEAGMQAFEDMQTPIRDMMKSAIEWLQSEEGINTIKRIGNTVRELIDILLDFGAKLFGLYKQFEGVIKIWLTTQVKLTLILAPLRALRSLLSFGTYMTGSIKYLAQLAKMFGEVGRVAGLAGRAIVKFNWATLKNAQVPFLGTTHTVGALNRTFANKVKQIVPTMGVGIGTAAMGGVGAYLGSKIGEEGSVWSGLGAIGGGLAGMFAGGALFSKLASLAPLLTGWVGIIAAAIGAISFFWVKNLNSAKKATEATKAYLDLVKTENGINMTEKASTADKYYQILYNGQLNANDALAEYIRLRRIEMGLDKERKKGEIFGETEEYGHWVENLKKPAEILNYFIRKGYGRAFDSYDAYGKIVKNSQFDYSIFGRDYSFNIADTEGFNKNLLLLQADRALLPKFGAYAPGALDTELRDKYTASLYRAGSTEEYNKTYNLLLEAKKKALADAIPGSKNWNIYDYKNHTTEEIENSYRALEIAYDSAIRAVQTNLGLQAYYNILKNPNDANLDTVSQLLRFGPNNGNPLFLPGMGKFGSPVFWGNLGLNTKTDEWFGIPGAPSGPEAKKNAEDLIQHTVEQLDYFDPKVKRIIQILLGLTDDKYLLQLQNQQNPQKPLVSNPTTNGSTGNEDDGDLQTRYKSHYASGRTTPKQIIVNIENLMNVDNVDLTNPNNVAVVNDLKTQLAEALTDVVSDFSVNLGNLA